MTLVVRALDEWTWPAFAEFSMADWQTQILAALRMGRRTPEGPGWVLGYRPTGNGPEWVWADGEVCNEIPDHQSPPSSSPWRPHASISFSSMVTLTASVVQGNSGASMKCEP